MLSSQPITSQTDDVIPHYETTKLQTQQMMPSQNAMQQTHHISGPAFPQLSRQAGRAEDSREQLTSKESRDREGRWSIDQG